MLFKISDSESFLLGAAHLLADREFQFPESWEKAWQSTQKLVVETTEKAGLRDDDMLPNTTTLMQQVGVELSSKLERACKELGLVFSNYAQLKPWILGLALASAMHKKSGRIADLGIEAILRQKAAELGRKPSQLETAEAPLNALRKVDQLECIAQLDYLVGDLPAAIKRARALLDCWASEDLQSMLELYEFIWKRFPQAPQFLLIDRNKAWLPLLLDHIRAPESAFIAVGYSILSGLALFLSF